jgi:phage gp29-like protein
MSLKSEIQALLAKLVPTKTRVIVRGRQQPPASSHLMDVDLLHSYLRMAEAGDTTLLFGLYRDILASHSHTQGEFSKRKLAVLGDPLTITAKNPDDPAEAAWAAELQEHLTDRPGLVQFLSHCLDSTMYPVALTARSWRPSTRCPTSTPATCWSRWTPASTRLNYAGSRPRCN